MEKDKFAPNLVLLISIPLPKQTKPKILYSENLQVV